MTIPQSVSLWVESQRKRSPYKNLGVFATSGKLAGSSEDKEALQQLADAEERSLSQMAVLIVKQAQNEGKIPPSQGK